MRYGEALQAGGSPAQWGISSDGRALPLQGRCQGFDSPILHRFGLRLRPMHGGRGVVATRWTVTPESMGSTPSDRPNALVAQWRAHRLPKPGVAGSSPAEGTGQVSDTSVAQRIERQFTKLEMGVRFSPGVRR